MPGPCIAASSTPAVNSLLEKTSVHRNRSLYGVLPSCPRVAVAGRGQIVSSPLLTSFKSNFAEHRAIPDNHIMRDVQSQRPLKLTGALLLRSSNNWQDITRLQDSNLLLEVAMRHACVLCAASYCRGQNHLLGYLRCGSASLTCDATALPVSWIRATTFTSEASSDTDV